MVTAQLKPCNAQRHVDEVLEGCSACGRGMKQINVKDQRSSWIWWIFILNLCSLKNPMEEKPKIFPEFLLFCCTQLGLFLPYFQSNLSYLLYPVFIALHQVQKMLYHKIAWFLLHITAELLKGRILGSRIPDIF